MLSDGSKLVTPPEPTGDCSISQGDSIKILCSFCSSKLLTTSSLCSSKSQTCNLVGRTGIGQRLFGSRVRKDIVERAAQLDVAVANKLAWLRSQEDELA
ncbi:hypothetical protein V6N13_015600 [Hibiscus sabdariffa]|uniref:Uncharacterized protein n=1 Tax=Hibiscus sabdariffa TaxID=183260 RepID=A0ABR2CWG4_9ROSI